MPGYLLNEVEYKKYQRLKSDFDEEVQSKLRRIKTDSIPIKIFFPIVLFIIGFAIGVLVNFSGVC